MFYFHPWELDPGQPRPSMAWHRRFRHYVGQARHEAKLAHLLGSAAFGTARAVLERSGHGTSVRSSQQGSSAGSPVSITRNGTTS